MKVNLNLCSPNYWDNNEVWPKYVAYLNYPGSMLERILPYLSKEKDVLDIGSGTGLISLKIAPFVKTITALDICQKQLNTLITDARNAGIKNLNVIHADFLKQRDLNLRKYDVTILAYILFMEDLKSFLNWAKEITKETMFIVHMAWHDLLDVSEKPKNTSSQLFQVLNELKLKYDSKIYIRKFSVPFHIQLELLSYNGYQIKRIVDHFVLRKSIFSKEGMLWVKRVFHDVLITVNFRSC